MKLYIKKTENNNKEKSFYIADMHGNKVYDWHLFGILEKKIRIQGADREEAAVIKYEKNSFFPKCQVCIGEKKILEITKEIHTVLPKYIIRGLNWELEKKSSFFHYSIQKNGERILSVKRTKDKVHRDIMYEIHISDPKNEIAAVAAVIAINLGIEGRKFLNEIHDENYYYDKNKNSVHTSIVFG